MGNPNPGEKERRLGGLTFRQEISVGNLITAVGMIVAALVAWSDLSTRVAIIGDRVNLIAEHSVSREPHPDAEQRLSVMETRQQAQNAELIRRMDVIEREMVAIRRYISGNDIP